jgi:hypothetical protein
MCSSSLPGFYIFVTHRHKIHPSPPPPPYSQSNRSGEVKDDKKKKSSEGEGDEKKSDKDKGNKRVCIEKKKERAGTTFTFLLKIYRTPPTSANPQQPPRSSLPLVSSLPPDTAGRLVRFESPVKMMVHGVQFLSPAFIFSEGATALMRMKRKRAKKPCRCLLSC